MENKNAESLMRDTVSSKPSKMKSSVDLNAVVGCCGAKVIQSADRRFSWLFDLLLVLGAYQNSAFSFSTVGLFTLHVDREEVVKGHLSSIHDQSS